MTKTVGGALHDLYAPSSTVKQTQEKGTKCDGTIVAPCAELRWVARSRLARNTGRVSAECLNLLYGGWTDLSYPKSHRGVGDDSLAFR
jgi:hypothetical protein